MENNEHSNQIKTIGELKKYLGKVVVSYYYNVDGEISFMWMYKLVRIKNQLQDDIPITHIIMMGLNHICLINNTSYKYKIGSSNEPPFLMYTSRGNLFDMTIPMVSSAQEFMRPPTKEELNTYFKLTRKRRILGYD